MIKSYIGINLILFKKIYNSDTVDITRNNKLDLEYSEGAIKVQVFIIDLYHYKSQISGTNFKDGGKLPLPMMNPLGHLSRMKQVHILLVQFKGIPIRLGNIGTLIFT